MRMLANGMYCSDEHKQLHENGEVETPNVEQSYEGPLALAHPHPRHRDSVPECDPIPIAHAVAAFLWLEEEIVAIAGVTDVARPKLFPLAEPVRKAAPPRVRVAPVQPITCRPSRTLPVLTATPENPAWPPTAAKVEWPFANPHAANKGAIKTVLTTEGAAVETIKPRLNIDIEREKVPGERTPLSVTEPERPRAGGRAIDLSSQKLREIWRNAPSDLKLIAMVIPMILLLTLNATGPKIYTKPVAIKATYQPPNFDGMLTRRWQAFRRSIAQRAAFAYDDDFRSGLDAWSLTNGSQAKWTYDNMGFVRPGSLALLRPTMQLSDYHVEFIARFEQKALGFVFRAADASNYQGLRLEVTKPGAVPEVHVIRYAVLNGHESARSDKVVPTGLTNDTFFNVSLDVRGDDFTLMVQGKLVDFWSDGRLKSGGIGFFCGKGESACLRRVQVSYQDDPLGRFCAFIAAGGPEGKNGS